MDKFAISDLKITPKSRYCYGTGIRKAKGDITSAENILLPDGKTTIIEYKKGGLKPRLIIDLGEASPGGYPVFTINSKRNTPVLRLSYSDYYGYIDNEEYDTTGDFLRGDCKYLGVELPVLPANPNRFELYTINRTGKFFYPLIQGQQRFVMITLDNEDTQVELESFFIYYTSDISPYDGYFKSSSHNLNRLWYASIYTAQLASLDNSQSFDIVEGHLAVRALTKGNRAGIYKKGTAFTDYTFEFEAQISVNPHTESGIGWMVRAKDMNNGYMFMLDLDGSLSSYLREDGINKPLYKRIYLDFEIIDNTNYIIKTEVMKDSIKIYINEVFVFELNDGTFEKGTVGFCQTVEKWAIVNWLKVYNDSRVLLDERWENGLDDYEFTRSKSFVSDGAKRDRLPWSGDLYWAGRNIYSAFSNFKYMPNTIKMLMDKQTPEGYTWGACYPEDETVPGMGEYGYYESDIFVAWTPIVLGDYLLYTGDLAFCKEQYASMQRVFDYIFEYVNRDGIFFQRYETSKGLWDHELNDFGKYSYNNMIMYYAFVKGAFVAEKLGDSEKSEEYLQKAELIKKGIYKYFWDDEKKYFKVKTGSDVLCPLANSIAADMQFLSQKDGKGLITTMLEWLTTKGVHGKIVSLFINGCFLYSGFEDVAYKTMLTTTSGVNWIDNINHPDCPATTTECMHYPVDTMKVGHAWGDRSHPDTGIAYIITGYILGIRPLDMGFKSFVLDPHFLDIENVCGEIPTPYGNIKVSWEVKNGKKYVSVTHPKETTMLTELTDAEISETAV